VTMIPLGTILPGGILLAGIQDWIGAIVPIGFLIYALIQLFTAKGPQPPARKPQRRVAPEQAERPLRPQPPTAKPQGAPQAQLNAEIEQFLKRATQRRGDAARRRSEPTLKTPPRPAPRTIAPQSGTTQKSSPLSPGQPASGPVTAKPPAAGKRPRDRSSVSDSVEEHLSDRGFGRRAEHLADEIVRADVQMEEHVKTMFNRKVGRLGEEATAADLVPMTDTETAIVPSVPTSAIATLLANPQNARQAFILSEILARPEHRW
jgi:hypothetical protein